MNDSLNNKIALAEQEKASATSKDVELKYGEMVGLFRGVEKTRKGHVYGHIVFSSDSFTAPYSEEARTYVVSSDNKAFQSNMGGYSIYGSSLDGSDVCVRLEMYMCLERGGKDGWRVERCYMNRDEFDKANKLISEIKREEER